MIQIIKYDFHLANIRSDQIINGLLEDYWCYNRYKRYKLLSDVNIRFGQDTVKISGFYSEI